jgi:ATP-dependent Lon protease
MAPHSLEFAVIKTYLDLLPELPWNVLSKDHLDIIHARSVLGADHYDLEDVKDRLIEYLAVRKLITDRGIQTDIAFFPVERMEEAMEIVRLPVEKDKDLDTLRLILRVG